MVFLKDKLRGIFVGSIVTAGFFYGAFIFNIAGFQDWYYGSRYFRPYAELRQEPWFNQIVQMADGKILLIGSKQSEIFDPVTKRSEMVPGHNSVRAFGHHWNLVPLSDGNVLILQKDPLLDSNGDIICDNPNATIGRGDFYCPKEKTIRFNNKKKILEWIPFNFSSLLGQSATELPDGSVLLVGGRSKKYETGNLSPNINSKNIIKYSPKNFRYKVIGHLQIPRYDHLILLVDKYHALVMGGRKTTGEQLQDLKVRNNRLEEVELIDLRSGKSKVIGKMLTSRSGVFNTEDEKYINTWSRWGNGVIYSTVFDLKHIDNPIYIEDKPPANHWEGLGHCVYMPNRRLICPAGKEVREIDPIQLKSRVLDSLMTPMLLDTTALYVPKIGLLVFGNSRHLLKKVRTVQRFDYDRYLKDLHEVKGDS